MYHFTFANIQSCDTANAFVGSFIETCYNNIDKNSEFVFTLRYTRVVPNTFAQRLELCLAQQIN